MKSSEENQVTPERLMQLSFAYAAPIIIGAAISNNVFGILAAGPRSIEEVAKATGASTRGLRAVMNALVGLELLLKTQDGKYSLTAESERFLTPNKPGSLAAFFGMNRIRLMQNWMKLDEIVKSGRPAVAVNEQSQGTEFFSQLVENIMPMSFPAAQALADHLNVKKAASEFRVLDLAAGSGVWGIALAQKSPHVRVTAVDWPGMVSTTKRITDQFGVGDRFQFLAGDLLEVDFDCEYDLATLGHILHSEGEQRSREVLKKTFAAVKSGGTIAIAEWLVNDERTGPAPALFFAVNMLVNTESGDAFSFSEIKSWLEQAGFRDARTLEVPAPSPLILATKP